MDPDGLDILILAASGVLALVLAWCAGSLLENDSERQQQMSIGFSSRFCGVVTCALFSFAAFAYGLLQIFVKPAHLVFAALCFLALCFLCVFAAAFGALHGKDEEESFALFRPIGAIIAMPAVLLFRSMHLKVVEDVTEEDFLNLVDDVAQDEVINEHQKEMITNIVELGDVTAGEIMTHRKDVIGVPITATVSDVVTLAEKNGVSRLPVYNKTMDDIEGILYAKDLFAVWNDENNGELSVKDFVRPAMFVPEARPARFLLVDFRAKHTQIAVVVDEYGGTSGVVTMEDIIEEIVGNIQDEFDDETEDFQKQSDGSVIATGGADLEELFKTLGLSLPSGEEFEFDSDTVGGFVFDKLGRIPERGEKAFVQYEDVLFTVLKADDRRIESVLCEVKPAKKVHHSGGEAKKV